MQATRPSGVWGRGAFSSLVLRCHPAALSSACFSTRGCAILTYWSSLWRAGAPSSLKAPLPVTQTRTTATQPVAAAAVAAPTVSSGPACVMTAESDWLSDDACGRPPWLRRKTDFQCWENNRDTNNRQVNTGAPRLSVLVSLHEAGHRRGGE